MKRLRLLLAELTVLAFTLTQMASAALTNRYVDKNNAGAAEPYDAWGNAASNIQTAIDYAYAGETVLVAAATYDTGGVTNFPAGTILTNRVAIHKVITVKSANNDPATTIIKGAWGDASGIQTNGPAAVRCVYMTNYSSLIGFTLTNGATLLATTPLNDNKDGGGVYCQSTNSTISNCVIIGNTCGRLGGGALAGTLYNCLITSNYLATASTWGGGAYGSVLYSCIVSNNYAETGGGASACRLYNSTIVGNLKGTGVRDCTMVYNCIIVGNKDTSYGGGARGSTVYNSMIVGNYSAESGGGAFGSTLYNCTIVGNQAATSGGGVDSSTLYNSIIYFNTAPVASNWSSAISPISFTNSCTTTAQVGWASGNITADPIFIDNGSGYGLSHVGGDYRLRVNSPCVNAGLNQNWMTNAVDLDTRVRIRYGTVDIGAYEAIYEGTIFYIGF